VRPGLRVYLALRLRLDPVVADRGRRVEPVVDVRLRQVHDQPRLHRVGRPDARVAIRLELGADGLALRPLERAADPVQDAELVLHVVAVLVGDHIGLDERRVRGAEARGQLVEETKVDVHELVCRTVERPHVGARDPAPRLHLAREEDGVHVVILLAAPLEDAAPEALDAVHDADDAAVVALVRGLAALAFLLDVARYGTLSDLRVVERAELPETAVAARQQRDQQEHDETCDSETSAADCETAWAHRARTTPADVGDLTRIELLPAAKAHVSARY